MVASIIAAILHIPMCLLFVCALDCGVIGLAYATTLKEAILLAVVIIYCKLSERINTVLQPIDREAFNGWYEYLAVSLPATVMICSEWWAFEALTIMAGMLGVIQLATQTISINVLALLYMVVVGI